ncbi:F-box/kelch-repeat protein [Senna tora]|uniref:F-box/kelch-repeat protein n=1 Tax=Senna tora TaxID=362788 RepID=A0A834X5I2_9FABA|nr:F-box/kelch-repeat protein [Senna tora]
MDLLFENPNGIPRPIMSNIFSRLPIPDIRSVKCVCKNWNRSCRNTGFLNEQSMFSKQNNTQLVIECDFSTENNNYTEIVVVADDYKDEIIDRAVFIPANLRRRMYTLVGSEEGVLCITAWKDDCPHKIYLINPTIIDSMVIKLPCMMGIYDPHATAFVYDYSTDEFYIAYMISRDKVKNSAKLYSFSSKSQCWDIITQLEVHVGTFSETSVHLNGIVFWLASKADVKKIITFDISSWERSIITVHNLVEQVLVELVRVQDRIGLLTSKVNIDSSKDFIVWINNDLTLRNIGWTQYYRISNAHRAFIPYSFINYKIFCVLDKTIETDIPIQDSTKYLFIIGGENNIMLKRLHCPDSLTLSVLKLFHYYPTLRK